ncbi:MAG: hypothetical protein ACREDD_07080 [Methylocella sp.]
MFHRTHAFAKFPHGLGALGQIPNRGFEGNSLSRFRAGHADVAVAIDARAAKIAVNAAASIPKLSGKRRSVLVWAAHNRRGDRGISVVRNLCIRLRRKPRGRAFATGLQGGLLPLLRDRGGHATRKP